jgi:hypothetical protein
MLQHINALRYATSTDPMSRRPDSVTADEIAEAAVAGLIKRPAGYTEDEHTNALVETGVLVDDGTPCHGYYICTRKGRALYHAWTEEKVNGVKRGYPNWPYRC